MSACALYGVGAWQGVACGLSGRLGVSDRRGRRRPGRLGRLEPFRRNACAGSASSLSWTCCGRGAVAGVTVLS